MIYGDLPEDLGYLDLPTDEMMFWLYCPVSVPGKGGFVVPDNLRQFWPVLDAVWRSDMERITAEYVYLTVKSLWVTPQTANRPGWHADGFGTNDLNFVWCDRAPTEFYADSFTLPDDCADSMAIMAERAEGAAIITYPDRHLLRLTPSVIHRVAPQFAPGMRTFVKVSVSPDRYNLVGNSINHGIEERWPMVARSEDRNHPRKEAA